MSSQLKGQSQRIVQESFSRGVVVCPGHGSRRAHRLEASSALIGLLSELWRSIARLH